MIGIERSEASASALTDAICLPAKAAFPAASQQDGNSGSVPRSPPTINDALGDRKPQPGAALLAGDRIVGLPALDLGQIKHVKHG